jgi:hypothetical protein
MAYSPIPRSFPLSPFSMPASSPRPPAMSGRCAFGSPGARPGPPRPGTALVAVWPDANPTPSPVDRVTKITGDKPLAVNVRRPLLLAGRPWRESGIINRFGAKTFSLSLPLVRGVAACGHDPEEPLRGSPWREATAGHVDVALAGLPGRAWREGPLPDIPAYLDCAACNESRDCTH